MVENLNSKIEKPWAVYSWGLGTSGIAKVVKEYENGLDLKYSDYNRDWNPWESFAVKRFNSSDEAILYHSKNNFSGLTLYEVKTIFCRDFPKTLKQESIQNFYNTLVSYKNKISSQSSPKCTEVSKSEEVSYALEQSNVY